MCRAPFALPRPRSNRIRPSPNRNSSILPNCATTIYQPSTNHASTTTQASFVSNPRTIPTQPSRIRDFPTTTQPLAKGFVRRWPKAHGASANTPYPFARTFAPPPHCRRTNRSRFAASTTRCRRYKTLSDFIPTTTTLCKRSGDGGGEGRALRGRMRPRDWRRGNGSRA